MYELPPEEFLFLFYIKLNKKLERILELTEKVNKTTDETKELFETKSKVLEAIDLLVLSTNDDDLKNAYIGLMQLIGSQNPQHIKLAMDYCIEARVTV
jgi:hypothetical protein